MSARAGAPRALLDRVGEEVGVSPWHDVTQEAVNTFADATGDHQWIHIDPERAARGPFGRTIAHGYYTLSLAPKFFEDMKLLDGAAVAVNYGLNRVRFTAPVPVGSRVRMRVVLLDAEEVSSGTQLTWQLTFECSESEKPVCVAESLARVAWA